MRGRALGGSSIFGEGGQEGDSKSLQEKLRKKMHPKMLAGQENETDLRNRKLHTTKGYKYNTNKNQQKHTAGRNNQRRRRRPVTKTVATLLNHYKSRGPRHSQK